jgi:hypothetical protein
MKRQLIWMIGAPALLVTLGLFSRPVALLAQVVKSTLVRSVDEPGREPYMETKSYTPGSTLSPGCQSPVFINGPLGPITSTCTIFFTQVPAGKRLIIKNINSRISFLTSQATGYSAEGNLAVNATVGAAPQASIFFLQPHVLLSQIAISSPINGYMGYLQSHTEVQAYADPGTTPIYVINVNNAGSNASSYITLSGYYVDIP